MKFALLINRHNTAGVTVSDKANHSNRAGLLTITKVASEADRKGFLHNDEWIGIYLSKCMLVFDGMMFYVSVNSNLKKSI